MPPSLPQGRVELAATYGRLAVRYWLSIFPQVRRETRRWGERAERIPDPALRRLALEAMRGETAQAEGVGAFAALVPRESQDVLLRAAVVLVTLLAYLDALAEQPSDDPVANGAQLHGALLAAVAQGASHADFYAYSKLRNDGGYLRELVGGLGTALGDLPSYREISTRLRRQAEEFARYQSLNLAQHNGGHTALSEWARDHAPGPSNLRWWERAGGAASAASMVALMAAATETSLGPADVDATCVAFTRWVDPLATLLDSAVDEPHDLAAGQRGLVSYYASPEEAAQRLCFMAEEAVRALSALPNGSEHLVIFAGMVGSYVSRMPATPMAKAISRAVLEPIGFLARPTLAVFRVRQAASRLASARRRSWPVSAPRTRDRQEALAGSSRREG